MAGALKFPVRQCDLIFYWYVNYERAQENKRPETMTCSNSIANTLELWKRDNAINITYAAIEQIDVELKQISLGG